MINDAIRNSLGIPDIQLSEGMFETMMGLRSWMFENVYQNSAPKAEEGKAEQMIAQMYDYYLRHPEEMPEEYLGFIRDLGEPMERTVCDFIAGMSDQYAIKTYEDKFIPKAWTVF